MAGERATVWVRREPGIGFLLRILFPEVRVEIFGRGLELDEPEQLLDELERL